MAETAVLNNNYLLAGIAKIRGASIPWPANPHHRLEQVRYSWEQLARDTGVTTDEILLRMVDYGLQHYMTSHHPMLVPEPFTIEPGESYSLDELDECLETLRRIADEAYSRARPREDRPAPRRRASPRRGRRRRPRQMGLHLARLGAQARRAAGLRRPARDSSARVPSPAERERARAAAPTSRRLEIRQEHQPVREQRRRRGRRDADAG